MHWGTLSSGIRRDKFAISARSPLTRIAAKGLSKPRETYVYTAGRNAAWLWRGYRYRYYYCHIARSLHRLSLNANTWISNETRNETIHVAINRWWRIENRMMTWEAKRWRTASGTGKSSAEKKKEYFKRKILAILVWKMLKVIFFYFEYLCRDTCIWNFAQSKTRWARRIAKNRTWNVVEKRKRKR